MLLTRKQREAFHKVFLRKYPHAGELRKRDAIDLYRKFRRTAFPILGGDCVMVEFAGMWLGIEKDGHTHS